MSQRLKGAKRMSDKPKISVISPSKNTGRFAKETIESILSQTYKSWEHIIVDGMSTDETLEVIGQYPHIRWISEKDNGFDEAFRKGLAMANGEYVMLCCISDGFLDKNWFKKCTEYLDNHLEISLVWGLPQNMLEDGALDRIVYDYFFDDTPPQEKDFIHFWLKTYFHLPEGNFCVRRNILDNCYPKIGVEKIGEKCGFLTFNYNFNTSGYLPYFIPVVANYGRIHRDSASRSQQVNGEEEMWIKRYRDDIKKYKKQLSKGEVVHRYRDGLENLLTDKFNPKRI